MESWCVFLSIYALLLTDFWLECIRKEPRYMLNRRYLARTNDIWALGVVLVTMVNRHTVLTTVIPSFAERRLSKRTLNRGLDLELRTPRRDDRGTGSNTVIAR